MTAASQILDRPKLLLGGRADRWGEFSPWEPIEFLYPLLKYGAFCAEDEIVQTQEKPVATETSTDSATVDTAPATAAAPVKPVRSVPFWASLSVALNGFLLLAISLAYWKPQLFGFNTTQPVAIEQAETAATAETPNRQSLPYEEWLAILEREAKAVALKNPERLTVLLGDSLTLWFPQEMLAKNRQWLNQGISGENTSGLLKRLNLLDELKPQTIFVMVGINDLIKGASDKQLLENYGKVLAALKEKQPEVEIVVQSILPHGGDRMTVDDREQALQVSNDRIVQLNRKLKDLAAARNVKFLDLNPVFTDADGLLRATLSTDGLHLNDQGYAVWQAAMQTFDQLELNPPIVPQGTEIGEPQPDIQEALPDAPAADAQEVLPEAPAP